MHGHEHSAERGHGRAHGHGAGSDSSRMMIASGINLAITAGQAIAGVVAGSLALLGDAAHNLTDTAAVILALIAMRVAQRPASTSRTYGGVRWPILAAQANSIVMLGLTALLAIESLGRFGADHEVKGGLVLVVALIGAIGNGGAALLVHRPGHDLNARAVVLHLAGDALVSVGVAIAGLVVLVSPDATWADPLAGVLVSLVLAWQGAKLLRQSSLILLEAVPPGVDLDLLLESMLAIDGVEGVHDLHVWCLSDTVFAASAHLSLGEHRTVRDARVISDGVKRMLAAEYGIGHTTLEIE